MGKRTICIFALLVCLFFSLLFSGCQYSTYGHANDAALSSDVTQTINPNNEHFTYISSSRTVEDDIVTITFKYKIEEPEEEE